jgi:multiple antibiotic resistance protein
VALVSWATLHFSGEILDFLGTTGMNALTRIMGLLLVCVGIQFVATGFLEGLTGERVTGMLREWLITLQPAE